MVLSCRFDIHLIQLLLWDDSRIFLEKCLQVKPGPLPEKHQGIQLIVSSTWQGQTSFQKMVGFEPKPAIVSVVKLDDMSAVSVGFT